jgi:hypothetical protein
MPYAVSYTDDGIAALSTFDTLNRFERGTQNCHTLNNSKATSQPWTRRRPFEYLDICTVTPEICGWFNDSVSCVEHAGQGLSNLGRNCNRRSQGVLPLASYFPPNQRRPE